MENKERARMPQNNPDFWAAVFSFLQALWPNIAAAFAAFWIGALRIMYDGGTIRAAWLEGAFVAFISGCAVSGLIHLGMSPELAGSAGGLAGFIGVERLRIAAGRFFDRKVDSL